MEARATTQAPFETGADTVCIGLFAGEPVAHDPGGLQALVDAGEARPALRRLAQARVGGVRVLLVGLGPREAFDAERARGAAAVAHARARELGAQVLCWELPHRVGAAEVEGFVEGTLLAAYRFDAYREEADADAVRELVVSAHDDVGAAVATGAALAHAQNAARTLQDRPPNDLTPTALGLYAERLGAEEDGLEVEVLGPDELRELGMGAFLGVAQGSDQPPRLIVLRYDGPGASGAPTALVGKAVTFDSGGISIKPAAKMSEMKYDMSGGAAVIEAVAAAARLALPVRVLGLVGATENLPGGRALKPGDILRAKGGLSVEIVNTDAEGRLVLADCLAHAVDLGAGRVVDIATLTGGIVVALGSTYAGLMGSDDALCAELVAAGERAGERLWRLPLDPEYADLVKGQHADLKNAVEERKASSITAAEFLARFAGEVPWAHIDIAGTAWNLGRPYAGRGGAGFGVRLLVELLRGAPEG